MRNSGIFLLLLLALLSRADGHKETGKGPRDVHCSYIEDDRGYVCELVGLTLFDEEDTLRFTGKQMPGKTNEDVTCLHIHSSESHIVPSENIFNYFTNLMKLEMTKVSVKKIDQIINCWPLELIDFSGNLITALEAGVFIECVDLETLDLSSNQISRIEDNAFSSLKELRNLDLSGNHLVKLSRKIIKPLKNMRKLSLQANRLKELSHDLFNDMFHLEELNLSENPLTRLDFRFFDYTIHIETLLLRATNIKKFHPFTFKNLRRLRSLDISQNNLGHIDNDLLSTNKQVEELRMNEIDMKSMGRWFFEKLSKLKLFHAHGNQCVDGIFEGGVVDIRPNFLKCFEQWDLAVEQDEKNSHAGDEL